MKAVSDAGPSIHLSWIGRLDLLGLLFAEVLVPRAVALEVLRTPAGTLGIGALRARLATPWLRIQDVADQEAVSTLRRTIDLGEAEAIVLAHEADTDLLLVDDRLARLEATSRGLPISGTLGILRRARQWDLIPAACPLVDELRRHGSWVSDALVEQLRREES